MMTIDEAKLYLDNEIKHVSDDGRNKLYIMNLYIDESIGNVVEIITKYLNNKQISVDVHKCNVRNSFELVIWW